MYLFIYRNEKRRKRKEEAIVHEDRDLVQGHARFRLVADLDTGKVIPNFSNNNYSMPVRLQKYNIYYNIPFTSQIGKEKKEEEAA